jgi:anti-sigma regulatory factor (Ser/Thr protein kinase)
VDDLAVRVADFVAGALADGEAAVVIAVDGSRRAVSAALRARGIDVDAARARSAFVELDAAATLQRFTTDARVDRQAFRAVIGELITQLSAAGRSVRAYGEMVAVLWNDGFVAEALELETAWNELADELRFELYCSYPRDLVARPEQADELAAMCALHSHVVRVPAAHRHVVSAATSRMTRRRFDVTPDAAALARTFVEESLSGLAEPGSAEAAVLVASELVTNAVRHTRSAPTVTVVVGPEVIRIEVTDAVTARPVPSRAPVEAASGRGLTVVAAVAQRWGYLESGTGKTVWAELPRPE